MAAVQRREEGGVAPRPWHIQPKLTGGGEFFVVVDNNGNPVAENLFKADAELIVRATDPAAEIKTNNLLKRAKEWAKHLGFRPFQPHPSEVALLGAFEEYTTVTNR